MTKKPYRECTRLKNCSVNNCPLSSQYPDLYTDIEDKQKECMSYHPMLQRSKR